MRRSRRTIGLLAAGCLAVVAVATGQQPVETLPFEILDRGGQLQQISGSGGQAAVVFVDVSSARQHSFLNVLAGSLLEDQFITVVMIHGRHARATAHPAIFPACVHQIDADSDAVRKLDLRGTPVTIGLAANGAEVWRQSGSYRNPTESAARIANWLAQAPGAGSRTSFSPFRPPLLLSHDGTP